MKRYNEIDQASAVNGKEPEHNRVGEEAQASSRGQHIFAIGLSLAASVISGAIFLISLVDQLALVEIAASLGTAFQVFFFSSALADLIEGRKTSRGRNAWVIVFAVLLIAFYSFTRYFPGALDSRVGQTVEVRQETHHPYLTCASWPRPG